MLMTKENMTFVPSKANKGLRTLIHYLWQQI